MKERWMPWKKKAERDEYPFDLLRREVDELFGAYPGFGRPGWRSAGDGGFELSETDDEVRVRIELPGMDEKDIEVLIENGMLTIRGERKREKETRKRNYHVSEMSYGSYGRTIPLPSEIDKENVEARFKRGVLTLTLPKTEWAKADRKRIPVSVD